MLSRWRKESRDGRLRGGGKKIELSRRVVGQLRQLSRVQREYRRHIKIPGDRVTLTTPPIKVAGEQRINSLTFERVK